MADAPDPWALPDVSSLVVGVLGGTGDEGRGLARRWALAGQRVLVGSRDAGRGAETAQQLGLGVEGGGNEAVAERADVVVVTVPWEGHGALLAPLSGPLGGKVVVDCVNPLGFDKQGAYLLDVPEGSAAQQAAGLLPDSRVVGAFHHVSASLLLAPDVDEVAMDVLVVGDDRGATDIAQGLVARIPGMRGVFAGRLRNARQVEGLTANLISVNRRYRTHAGLRVTGV